MQWWRGGRSASIKHRVLWIVGPDNTSFMNVEWGQGQELLLYHTTEPEYHENAVRVFHFTQHLRYLLFSFFFLFVN